MREEIHRGGRERRDSPRRARGKRFTAEGAEGAERKKREE
jgi:hypothetical protein